jgi:outer membrane protein assembly factor BamB
MVYGLQARIGRRDWAFGIAATHEKPLTLVDKLLLVDEGRKLIGLRVEGGRKQFTFDAGSAFGTPVVAQGAAIVAVGAALKAVNLTTGKSAWEVSSSQGALCQPAVSGATVAVGSGDTLFAYESASGRSTWSYKVAQGRVCDVTTWGEVLLFEAAGTAYALDAAGPAFAGK